MKLKLLSGVAAAALCGAFLAAPGVQAAKGDGVRVGVLTCQVEGGTGFVFGSSKDLRCHFESASGRGERYVGAINKFGLDIGVTGPAVLTWAVLAPSADVGRGALAGSYVGASAEASAGVGAGAHLLVGGNDETISLQPLSVQGQTGVNAALAVSELVLDPA
jgi:Protein of unknown function (DUF992)